MKRQLGKNGPEISALGLGCMGMSGTYGRADDTLSGQVLNKALDLGVDMFDTSDLYGAGHNEKLIASAIGSRYSEAFIADKFGVVLNEKGWPAGANGKPEYVRECCERALQRLNTDCIDLYYVHRIDVETPIEVTVEALAELVKEGKIKHIGLSEATGNTIRRAAKVHPIAAVQSEYSIFSRDIEDDVLPACREVGAAFVAYSPLGRGLLTGELTSVHEKDMRSFLGDRFTGPNFEQNLALVEKITALAKQHSATAAQVALAWVLAQGEDIFAIFGTTKLENLQANLAALELSLSEEELATLSALSDEVAGARYDDSLMQGCLIETPEL